MTAIRWQVLIFLAVWVYALALHAQLAKPSALSSTPAAQSSPANTNNNNNNPRLNPFQLSLLKWYAANTTTSFAVGGGPTNIAFDGANVWIANSSTSNVTKIRVTDGATLGTFTVGGIRSVLLLTLPISGSRMKLPIQ